MVSNLETIIFLESIVFGSSLSIENSLHSGGNQMKNQTMIKVILGVMVLGFVVPARANDNKERNFKLGCEAKLFLSQRAGQPISDSILVEYSNEKSQSETLPVSKQGGVANGRVTLLAGPFKIGASLAMRQSLWSQEPQLVFGTTLWNGEKRLSTMSEMGGGLGSGISESLILNGGVEPAQGEIEFEGRTVQQFFFRCMLSETRQL